MQKYLHIWKKKRIFAAYFNSGIHNNQKRTKVMEMKCVWKCQTGKVVVKVVEVTNDWRFKEKVYRVYKERRWWWKMTYDKLENALAAAVNVSLLGNYNVMIERKA